MTYAELLGELDLETRTLIDIADRSMGIADAQNNDGEWFRNRARSTTFRWVLQELSLYLYAPPKSHKSILLDIRTRCEQCEQMWAAHMAGSAERAAYAEIIEMIDTTWELHFPKIKKGLA